jgi:hypothetical protein
MPLTLEQEQLLQLMRDDNSCAGLPYCPNDYWVNESGAFGDVFDVAGINEVENEFFNTRFHGLTLDDHRLYTLFLWSYYQVVQARDHLSLLGKLHSTLSDAPAQLPLVDGKPIRPGRNLDVCGKLVSIDLLVSVDDFYNLLELNPAIADQPLVVADLGPGWGRIGYVLAQVNPRICYVLLDIPAPLLVSSTYLPQRLPGCSVGTYRDARAIQRIDKAVLRDKSLWFLGTQDLQRMTEGAIDLFVNVASFQEMDDDQVNGYLEVITRVAFGGAVYLRNDWEGARSRYANYKVPAAWTQVFLRRSRFSPACFEAGYVIDKNPVTGAINGLAPSRR